MDCELNRGYTLATFCCSNSLHDRPTHDRAPSFNICSMWAPFFCCPWTVKAFEKLVNSVSAAKNGL